MLFYLPDFTNPILPETEAMHVVKVLRLGKGAEISVTNGKGAMAKARIADPNPRKCLLEIYEVTEKEKDWKGCIWLGVARAFADGGRQDLLLAYAAWALMNSQDRAMLELMGHLNADPAEPAA